MRLIISCGLFLAFVCLCYVYVGYDSHILLIFYLSFFSLLGRVQDYLRCRFSLWKFACFKCLGDDKRVRGTDVWKIHVLLELPLFSLFLKFHLHFANLRIGWWYRYRLHFQRWPFKKKEEFSVLISLKRRLSPRGLTNVKHGMVDKLSDSQEI